jgi:hypothetical protein
MRDEGSVSSLGAPALGALALLFAGIGASPSHAQFFSLEGRYQCLSDPQALCYDATPNAAPPTAPPPAVVMAPPATPPPLPPAKIRTAAPVAPPADPLAEIAARLERGAPGPRDVAFLRARAAAGDQRATELLAWCHLQSVGVQRDPVPAYLLYGVAARLGVPNAERDQAVVYETDMTPEERQTALAIENRVMRQGAEHQRK